MELEGSLPWLQKPIIGLYPETVVSSPSLHTNYFKICFNIILCLGLSNNLFLKIYSVYSHKCSIIHCTFQCCCIVFRWSKAGLFPACLIVLCVCDFERFSGIFSFVLPDEGLQTWFPFSQPHLHPWLRAPTLSHYRYKMFNYCNSMEERRDWEADSWSAILEIPHHLRNLK
jgi:hypothetical protein